MCGIANDVPTIAMEDVSEGLVTSCFINFYLDQYYIE